MVDGAISRDLARSLVECLERSWYTTLAHVHLHLCPIKASILDNCLVKNQDVWLSTEGGTLTLMRMAWLCNLMDMRRHFIL